MDCPKCHHQNPKDAIFCNSCGQKLEIECATCGKANPLGSKFCNHCGKAFSIPSAANRMHDTSEPLQLQIKPDLESLREGERRQATILFSDLSGYTTLNERLDPEEVEAITSRIKKDAVRIVENHGGIVNQFVGDEVLALFGIPTTHEDDPVRAIKVAMEIHELVTQITPDVEKKTGTKLRMHTGISTGLIVTNTRDNRDGSYGITGDAVNVGARLAVLAEIDEIIVCPETHKIISPYFDTKAFGAIKVKGKTKPIIPHRVIGRSSVQTRFEAATNRGLTDFTGREQELMTLHSCFEKMQTGKGQFVTLVGEAGLGKSRLMYEFRHSLKKSEVTVLQGRCQSYGKSIPYFPHINALRRGLNLREDDTPAEVHGKIIANVMEIDPSLKHFLPIYLHLLSVSSEDYPLPRQLQGQELIDAINEAIAAINILNSKRRPYVAIMEDWHWADEASSAALKHIISVIPSHQVMLIVIYRPDVDTQWGNWSHHTPITLNPLDDRNCEQIIRSVWNVDHIPEGIAPLVHLRTGGNPFFIEEICNVLNEEGRVQIKDRHAELTQSLEQLKLPNTVQAVIRARLDQLDHYNRETLRLASVIGREFSRLILDQISTFKERLSQAIEDLKLLELIQQIHVIPESEYMFKHVITQEVTYDTILLKRRKELHGLVGQAIEKLYQDRIEEQVNVLYRHFKRAENWEKAAGYGRKAANRAYRLGQFKESVTMFDKALSCLSKLPENRDNQENLIDLQLEMLWPLQFLGQQDQALKICNAAEAVANILHDPVRTGKIDFEYGLLHFFKNQYDQAVKYYLKILHHPGKGEINDLIETVKFPLAVTYFSTRDWQKASSLYSEVIQTRERSETEGEYSSELPFLPYTHSCHHLAYIRALQGRIQEAKKLINKGSIPALQSISNLQSQAYCTLWHSALAALIGEDFGVSERVAEVIEIAKKTDSPILLFLLYAAEGNACMVTGNFETAKAAYLRALGMIKGTSHKRYLDEVYHNLIESLLALNDFSSATEYLEKSRPLITLNPAINSSMFDYLNARIISTGRSADISQAENLYNKSIKTDEESGAFVLAARKQFYLASMLMHKKEFERSRMILNTIKVHFENWGIPTWQQKCVRALESTYLKSNNGGIAIA